MLFAKYLLMTGGIGMFLTAAGILTYDTYLGMQYRRALAADGSETVPAVPQLRWRISLALAMLAWAPILIALSIVVVPSGMAGVRVSQTQGTLAGTLYPGVHFVAPLLETVELFDTRDQLFTTGSLEDGKNAAGAVIKAQPLNVQTKEGLSVGLAITARYRVDPRHLDYIEANLPKPIEKEIVPPVVASTWRELVPNYTVREVFAAKREEVRARAAAMITQKLAADGIVVKEVMLRDIQLPPEYAKGLETLLLKEQESDRMGVETDIQQKQVRIALAGALKGIVCQRLVPRADKEGRAAALEVMVANGRIAQCIAEPQLGGDISEIIADGEYYGMQTFDQHLAKLVEQGVVDMEGAAIGATNLHDLRVALNRKGVVGAGARS